MKTTLSLGVALLAAALLPALTSRGETSAPAKNAAVAGSSETKADSSVTKSNRSVPFRGKVATVDSQQMTFTLSGPKQRTFHLTSDTKIEKEGKPAALGDIAAGDEARGLYQNEGNGQLVVLKASFGPKAEKSASEAKSARKTKSEEAGS